MRTSPSLLRTLGLLATAAAASAQLTIDYGFLPGANVPDNNQQGYANTQALGGLGTITNVTVSLSLSSPNGSDPMFLGDLYSSLTYGLASEGPRVGVLLNRVGRDNTNAFGSPLSSFTVNLDDTAGTNVFNATGNGTFQPDGRLISPNGAPVAFSPGSNGLSALNGGAYASNQFTLLVADVASGGLARLDSFGYSITGTPAASGTLAVGTGTGSTFAITGAGTQTLGANVVTNGGTGAGGALSINITSGVTTFSGVVSGASGIVKSGGGTLVLSGSNSYSGGTTFGGGVTEFSSGGLGTTGNLVFTGGGLRYSAGNTQDVSGRLVNSTSAIAVDTNGNNVTYASGINGSNTGGLTKSGSGVLTLTGNNTFTGTTTVAGGTLAAGATGGNQALGGTTSVVIQGGGTLLLNTGNQINNSAPVFLNGGSIVANGSLTPGQTTTVGALTLTTSSIIDLATVQTSMLFGASNGQTWTGGAVLSIYNWSGIAANGATLGAHVDVLRFGTDATGLNTGQLAQVIFYADEGTTPLGEGVILSDGTVVPIPEPASVLAGLGAVLALGWRLRRRKK